MIGQCLGDALGSPVEAQPPAVCRRYVDTVLRSGEVTTHARRGRAPFGQYTDDSQLARELLQSYRACRGFDVQDYAQRIAALFGEGRIFGYGRATLEAAQRLLGGAHFSKAGAPPPSAGNGSAMRAGPVGLLFYNRPDELSRVAHEQGYITHQDPRCSAGAVAIAAAVSMALRPGPIDVKTFASRLSHWVLPIEPTFAAALGELPGWIKLSSDLAAACISVIGQPSGIQDGWQGISPFVMSSVLWSLYAFLCHPDDYLKAIATAIAVGGDVDTTAAMTGALSGARLGLRGLPLHWAQHLTDQGTWGYSELLALAADCHAIQLKTPAAG